MQKTELKVLECVPNRKEIYIFSANLLSERVENSEILLKTHQIGIFKVLCQLKFYKLFTRVAEERWYNYL